MSIPLTRSTLADRKFVAVLIHGTFAHDAEWVKEGSVLRNALQERFRLVQFDDKFKWGAEENNNSHQDRIEGGRALAEHLRRSIHANPGIPHVLFTHSHGGNVGKYAIRHLQEQPEYAQAILGMVSFATPYIRCRPRDGDSIQRWMSILPILLIVLLIAATFVLFFFLSGILIDSLGRVAMYTTWILYVLGLTSLPKLSSAVRSKLDDLGGGIALRQSALKDQIDPYFPKEFRVIAVTARSDEASLWLKLLWGICEIPHLIWRGFTWLYFATVTILVLVCVFHTAIPDAGRVIFPLTVALAVSPLVFYIFQPIVAVIPRLVRAHGLGFGGESMMDNWILDIGISRDPTPQHYHREFRVKKMGKGLRHCAIFEDPLVLDYVFRELDHLSFR